MFYKILRINTQIIFLKYKNKLQCILKNFLCCTSISPLISFKGLYLQPVNGTFFNHNNVTHNQTQIIASIILPFKQQINQQSPTKPTRSNSLLQCVHRTMPQRKMSVRHPMKLDSNYIPKQDRIAMWSLIRQCYS